MLDDIKNSTDLANLKERINNCSDEELAALIERAAKENLSPKAIKESIKNWTADENRV